MEHSSDEQQHSGQSNLISQSSDQRNASDHNKILKKSNMVLKSKYLYFCVTD
jgi:hypothetical protein